MQPGTSPTIPPGENGAPSRRTGEWQIDLERLVSDIEADSPLAIEQLYDLLNRGVRFLILRWVGPHDVEDLVHETLLATVTAIRSGRIREPRALLSYVRGIARHLACTRIRTLTSRREVDYPVAGAEEELVAPAENPEDSVLQQERVVLMQRALLRLGNRQREILTRFYLQEQSKEQICTDMDLSPTQYRLLKNRAKAKVGKLMITTSWTVVHLADPARSTITRMFGR
jgi:RNA polymerase sigma factor (sigma-70 family)